MCVDRALTGAGSFCLATPATLEVTQGQISSLPQLPPDSGGICTGVDKRDHQYSPGLPPEWGPGGLNARVSADDEATPGEEENPAGPTKTWGNKFKAAIRKAPPATLQPNTYFSLAPPAATHTNKKAKLRMMRVFDSVVSSL